MLTIAIETKPGLATMNVWIDEQASEDHLRNAWNNAATGLLLSHLREAIRLECIKRGIDPNQVGIEPLN